MARARGKRVIISHHDFAGTPDLAVLTALTDRARAAGADIVKVGIGPGAMCTPAPLA